MKNKNRRIIGKIYSIIKKKAMLKNVISSRLICLYYNYIPQLAYNLQCLYNAEHSALHFIFGICFLLKLLDKNMVLLRVKNWQFPNNSNGRLTYYLVVMFIETFSFHTMHNCTQRLYYKLNIRKLYTQQIQNCNTVTWLPRCTMEVVI